MACVPAAASSPKTEACPAFAARSRWPSNSAFTRASQCGNRRRMLRPRPRRRRCDARGAQPPPSRWPRASKAPSTNAPPGCVRGAHRERSSLCFAIGRAASTPKQSSKLARRPPEPSGAATTAFRYGLESKAQRARDFRCWRGHAGLCPPRRGPRRGRGLQDLLTGQDWEACEARAEANVEKKVVAAQLDVFGK